LAQAILRIGGKRCECRLVVRRPANLDAMADGDVCVVDAYDDLPADCFEGVDTVVNCVGRTTPDPSGASLTHVNVEIPVAVARSAMRMDVTHFIQASSLSIFGQAHRIDRSTPVAPTSDYGRSKQLAEESLKALVDQGLQLAIVRLPMLYGCDIEGKLSRLVRLMVKIRWFPVPRDLPRRSILHIDNAATTVLALAERHSAGTFFASDSQLFDLEALVAAIRSERGDGVSVIRLPGWVFRVLRRVAPSVHSSLYEPSIVNVDTASYAPVQLPVTLEGGLRALVRSLPK